MTSAKQRIGIDEVMQAIVDRLPAPATDRASRFFLGRIVDSWFDEHRGVVCLVQAVSGSLSEGQVDLLTCPFDLLRRQLLSHLEQRIKNLASMKDSKDVDVRSDYSVQEVGILTPAPLRTGSVSIGQVHVTSS